MPVPFISIGLPEPEGAWREVDLEDLCRFFANATKFLLVRRLGIDLNEKKAILEEREPFDLKGLEKYLLEEDLLQKKLTGCGLQDVLSPVRASGQLPHGTVGQCLFESLSQGVERFAEKLAPYLSKAPLEPLEVDLGMSNFRLTGRIHAIYPERLLQYRYARIRPKDRLKSWIHHLVLNRIMPENYPVTSVLAGLDPANKKESVWVAWEYGPVENSEEILRMLLERYWAGLMRPLHFFPESSWTYAHMLLGRNRPREAAIRGAQNTWRGNDFNRGECDDPYYNLCFRNDDPLDSEFVRLSEEIFGPYLAHQKAF
jgi:exodeoxyribonuclease V gamma subunit